MIQKYNHSGNKTLRKYKLSFEFSDLFYFANTMSIMQLGIDLDLSLSAPLNLGLLTFTGGVIKGKSGTY